MEGADTDTNAGHTIYARRQGKERGSLVYMYLHTYRNLRCTIIEDGGLNSLLEDT